jgi:lipopolysaccharide export LptBFGC system permease protein LptF
LLLQLYILRQLLVSVGFAGAGIGLIVLPTIAIQAMNKLGAVSFELVLQYLPIVVAGVVPYLLPMAFLLGVVATYGRLSADREVVAIQMAGVHPARLLIPGLLVAVPLVLGTDRLVSQISPELRYRQRQYLRDAGIQQFIGSMSGSNVIQWPGGLLVSEENFDNVRRKVQLDIEDQGGSAVHLAADEALIDVEGDLLRIRLKNARVETEGAGGSNASPTYLLDLREIFPREVKDRSAPKYRSNTLLKDELEAPDLEPQRRSNLLFEIHSRHALACIYLVFLLLGIPTGIALRSSTQLAAFTGAVGYAFLYYVLAMRLGKVLAATGAVPSVFAAWATNALFALAGLVFFARSLLR